MSEKEMNRMKLALLINGIQVNEQILRTILKTKNALDEKGGTFSIEDAQRIAAEVNEEMKGNRSVS